MLNAASRGAVSVVTEPRHVTSSLSHEGESELVVDDCRFEGNTAQQYGGAAITACAMNSFVNQSTFLANNGSHYGGSISIFPDPYDEYSGYSSTVIAGSTFRSNHGQSFWLQDVLQPP